MLLPPKVQLLDHHHVDRITFYPSWCDGTEALFHQCLSLARGLEKMAPSAPHRLLERAFIGTLILAPRKVIKLVLLPLVDFSCVNEVPNSSRHPFFSSTSCFLQGFGEECVRVVIFVLIPSSCKFCSPCSFRVWALFGVSAPSEVASVAYRSSCFKTSSTPPQRANHITLPHLISHWQ